MKSILTSAGALRLGVALVVVLALVGGGLAYFLHGADKATAGTGDMENDEGQEAEILVKIVHSHYDKTFTMTEKRPADVRPYFEAPLETRVPGIVSEILADVGSVVTKGQRLVKVDVPDLEARAKQRKADVKLAEAQVEQKKAALATANAQLKAAKAKVDAANARLRSDVAYEKFRKKQAERYVSLLRDRAIDAQLVDEQEDRLQASIEATQAAREAVAYADAEVIASKARIDQANADIEEARQNVKAKEAELGYANAMLDYATVEAPFDGQIVRRNVDPGFFVQNAGSGHATPLLVIQRNDIVTVVIRVPDNYAPYVTPNTEAIFETPSLPGVKIHGKVTRYPQSLVTPENDRTMLVEVDLWNRSAHEFELKEKDQKFLDSLKPGLPNDPRGGKPIVPKVEGNMAGREMMPGMFGDMTLVLQKFDNVHMLPASAITIKGGITYIYVVKDGKAHLQQVKVEVNDGKLAKVELLDENGVIIGDLTGTEEVVVTNQSELNEGQPVKTALVENWKALVNGGHNEKR